jgi:hypothetical protein
MDWNGNFLPYKYPIDRPILAWIIAFEEVYIGDTIYRLLFEPGAFKIIRDKKTTEWRTWRPWEQEDFERENETKEAPPFIPERLIDEGGWGWESKAERIFNLCTLTDGTRIKAFPSGAAAKQGDPVDLIWVDEDIKNVNHVAEWQARLSDRRGKFLWSAFPHNHNEALLRMSQRAEDDQEECPENPDVFEIVLKHRENPYIPADEKKKRQKDWESWSEDERLARDEGQFLTDTVAMYPTFNKQIHCTPRSDQKMWDKIDKVMSQADGVPPNNWTRYLALDPGHAVTCVLLAAIPPPKEFGEAIVIYRELYLKRHNSDQLAEKLRPHVQAVPFEAFVIDWRCARMTGIGSGKTIWQQYQDSFRKYGIESARTGNAFLAGNDKPAAGCAVVRSKMQIRRDGTPITRIYAPLCPNLVRQKISYRKNVTGDATQDDPAKGQEDHAVDAERYLICMPLDYVKPSLAKKCPSPGYLAYQEFNKVGKSESPERSAKVFYMSAGEPGARSPYPLCA